MTIKPITEAPNPYNGIYNPPAEMLYADGFRIAPPIPEPAEGYTRIAQPVLVDVDGINGQWDMTGCDRLTSEIEAEARAAYIAKCQPYFPQMVVYRETLRKYFGDGAETNRDVTRDTVAAYFMAKQMDGTITTLETADAFALTVNFERLSELVGANPPNTWELPWEAVP